ncbi:hypothetical protein Agub_g15806, partial [Astrephomene gubernaculifera]
TAALSGYSVTVITSAGTSLYMITELSGAPRWKEYEYHVCSDERCTGHLFGKPPNDGSAQEMECPHCGKPRYKTLQLGGKTVTEPASWFVYFGVEEVIRSEFFGNPEFCKQRGNFRGEDAPGSSMWHGDWANRARSYKDGVIFQHDSSIYDIGIDWITPYNSTQHSVGIVFIRCADVNPRDKGKSWNQHVIAIIPGPRIPSTLNPYMKIIVD